MPIIDPYETSYGKVINKTRLLKEVSDYVAHSSEPLSYEFRAPGDNTKLVFITGFNDEEKNLTVFDHPLVFKDIKNNNIVACDVRSYVNTNKDEQPLELLAAAKDTFGLKYAALRALLMADFLEHNYGVLRSSYSSITMSFASSIATLINLYVRLNPEDIVKVELACAYYINMLFVDAKDMNDMADNIVARISSFKYTVPVMKTLVTKMFEGYSMKGQTVYDLIDVIKYVLPEEKANIINDTVLVNLMSNIWYGPGGNETLVIGLEHAPTWIGVVYLSLANMAYKRARLSTMIVKSRGVDFKEFIKDVDIYIKERSE